MNSRHTPNTAQQAKKRLRFLAKLSPAALFVVFLYYADEIIFATPVVAVAAWLGAWPAFLIFMPAYFLFDLFLGTLMLRIISNQLEVEEIKNPVFRKVLGWVYNWFKSIEESEFGEKLKKTLSNKAGGHVRFVSFLVVSYLGSAFITTPFMYLLGQRKKLKLITFLSALIYAVTFVGKYALGTFIFINLVKFIISLFQ